MKGHVLIRQCVRIKIVLGLGIGHLRGEIIRNVLYGKRGRCTNTYFGSEEFGVGIQAYPCFISPLK